MIAAFITRLVDFSRRHSVTNALAALLLVLVAGWYAAGHLAIDTDIEKLLPADLAWRQNEIALDRAFPLNADLLAIVIDGANGDITDTAAQRLADKLAAEPQLFHNVRRPDGGAFFNQNGLLFLSVDDLNALSRQLTAAQPLIGSLSADPSLRGLFDTLKLFVEGATRGDVGIEKLDPTLGKIADVIDAVAAGHAESLSWQQVLTGTASDPHDLRKFVLLQPVLDYTALEPGAKATDEIGRAAAELGLTPQAGVRVRITGSVALDDEQFATLREGALRSALLSVGSVLVILLLGLRSPRAGDRNPRDGDRRAGDYRRLRGARNRLAEPALGGVRGAVCWARGRFQHPVLGALPRPAASPRHARRGARRRGADDRTLAGARRRGDRDRLSVLCPDGLCRGA